MLCWEPSRKFLRFAKENVDSRKCRESWILWIITATSCRTCTFPFIGSSQASEGEASTAKYHGFEAHPSTCRWYCPTLLSEVYTLQMQQPSFQKWGFAKPNAKAPVGESQCAFCLHKRSCCSTWVRSSRKFRESNAFIREEWQFPDKGTLINGTVAPVGALGDHS